MYHLYKFTFPNGKYYFGITNNITKRWSAHRTLKTGRFVCNAISKYGWENVDKAIVATSTSSNDILNLEDKYIREFKSNQKQFGYNLKTSCPYPKYSIEARKRMSKNHADVRGCKNPFFGKKHSDETINILREKSSRRKHSDEAKIKISLSGRGLKRSMETRQKISNARKGMKFSEQHKLNLSIARKNFLMGKE
jgi:group I intron endonuclease